MIQTVRKAWGIPELRKKILFTLLILVIYRIGSAIPVPYVDTQLLNQYLEGMGTTILGLYNVMSGGAFAQATVFALGIQPYINSSIIIQLLTVAIPALERMQREGGEEGKKKLQSITRYSTVAIALLQAFGYYAIMKQAQILLNPSVWAAMVIIISFVAGSSFLMWLGEQCNEFGVGNGISMILMAGIISRVPSMVSTMYRNITAGTVHWAWAAVAVVGTRKSTPYGISCAGRLAFDLASCGAPVVTGLARGGDTAAAVGALRAGGTVIGVTGNGLDYIYPPENQRLYEDVAAAGALLSEYPPGTEPNPRHFPVRNRIL